MRVKKCVGVEMLGCFFFFQAEDGIRDRLVTGVQTCALPICHPADCSRCPSWAALQSLKKTGRLTPQQSLIFRPLRPEYELYDLAADPWEFNNLADNPKYAEDLVELKSALKDWRTRTSDNSPDRRRRADNTNRVTGLKFTQKIPPLIK